MPEANTDATAVAAKPPVESKKVPVTMKNGSTVEFNEKEKMKLDVKVADDGSATVVADFRDGETRTATIPSTLAKRAIQHGLTQKVRDSIAGDKTVADAIASIEDVLAALTKGDWNQPREPGSAGPKGNSQELIDAIVKVKKLDAEKVKTWLEARTPAEKTKLRGQPEIALAIAQARAAKAKAAAKDGAPVVDAFEGLS